MKRKRDEGSVINNINDEENNNNDENGVNNNIDNNNNNNMNDDIDITRAMNFDEGYNSIYGNSSMIPGMIPRMPEILQYNIPNSYPPLLGNIFGDLPHELINPNPELLNETETDIPLPSVRRDILRRMNPVGHIPIANGNSNCAHCEPSSKKRKLQERPDLFVPHKKPELTEVQKEEIENLKKIEEYELGEALKLSKKSHEKEADKTQESYQKYFDEEIKKQKEKSKKPIDDTRENDQVNNQENDDDDIEFEFEFPEDDDDEIGDEKEILSDEQDILSDNDENIQIEEINDKEEEIDLNFNDNNQNITNIEKEIKDKYESVNNENSSDKNILKNESVSRFIEEKIIEKKSNI